MEHLQKDNVIPKTGTTSFRKSSVTVPTILSSRSSETQMVPLSLD